MGRITLDKVTKSFGAVEVIPPLDLTIEDGEFAVFVGPSGCGKSTLLRLIAGLEDVSSGQIRIDSQDATAVPPAKRGLAMVFQSYALYPHMSLPNPCRCDPPSYASRPSSQHCQCIREIHRFFSGRLAALDGGKAPKQCVQAHFSFHGHGCLLSRRSKQFSFFSCHFHL